MAQIMRVTSEALQATIRRLLPSQQGFGEDLQASNVIMPIIDLTPSAEGSSLPYELQTAQSFGNANSFTINGIDQNVYNNPGFIRISGVSQAQGATAAEAECVFNLYDGSTDKDIWGWTQGTGASQAEFFFVPFDFVVFLRTGDSLRLTTRNGALARGNAYEIADVNGNLTNPAGYQSQ